MLTPDHPTLLDCTLRDGSYALEGGWSAAQTRQLCGALQQAGVSHIELGHGVGLGAYRHPQHGTALTTDEQHMQAACEGLKHSALSQNALPQSHWGMFAIPGIATLADVDMAGQYEMGFIRLGCQQQNLADISTFIHQAKRHGMQVWCNIMKTYTFTPDAFARLAHQLVTEGADGIYIVDSAGGMLPGQLLSYIEGAHKLNPTIALGFHGHHNLGLGVSNTLLAWQHGVQWLDVSLQGIGRSAGNTPAEQLLAVLQRLNQAPPIDLLALMDAADTHVTPIMQHPGPTPLDVLSGFSLFHSSYQPLIERIARDCHLDPRQLMLTVMNHYSGLNELNTALIETCAKKMMPQPQHH
jgi:4-hydroxy 2-oxovalerate aldolase